ncbi:unnamed protein product [Paramecium sonneborni]|uniref:Uncharacterized protein n=1 Tax=Paramecium sonneborni TaxID=65129 RepID=A0A8S1N5H1_9CILI|nr:unnamed protein product [Paramecium sonneborni]
MSDHSQLFYNKDDNTDDLLLSQFSYESQFKSQESLPQRKKRQGQQAKQNQVIQEENSNSYIIEDQQTSYIKNQQESKEVQLLKLASHLRQLLQKQQQEFYEKELGFQQKLLTVQQQHDSMISLMKTKYQIIIEELQQKISMQQTENTNLKQQIFQLQEQQQNQLTQRMNKQSAVESNKDTNCFFTQRQTHQNSKLNDFYKQDHDEDKLLSLYKQEIDKVKQQTAEFERKFQNEKQSIKQEISVLKNQKLMLQTLITNKQVTNISTDKPYSQGMNSEHKTNKSKRDSQSRAYSHVSKKSFDF